MFRSAATLFRSRLQAAASACGLETDLRSLKGQLSRRYIPANDAERTPYHLPMNTPGWLQVLAGLSVSAGMVGLGLVGLYISRKTAPEATSNPVPPGVTGLTELAVDEAVAMRHPSAVPTLVQGATSRPAPVLPMLGAATSSTSPAILPLPQATPRPFTRGELSVSQAVAGRHPSAVRADPSTEVAGGEAPQVGSREKAGVSVRSDVQPVPTGGTPTVIVTEDAAGRPETDVKALTVACPALPGQAGMSVEEVLARRRPSTVRGWTSDKERSIQPVPLAFQAIPAMAGAELAAWKARMERSRPEVPAPQPPSSTVQSVTPSPVEATTPAASQPAKDPEMPGNHDALVEVTVSEGPLLAPPPRSNDQVQSVVDSMLHLDVLSRFELDHQGSRSGTASAALHPPTSLAARKDDGTGRWIPSQTPVIVGGIEIPGGMIYLGKPLLGWQGWGTDACLVDPSLPLSGPGTSGTEARNPPWATYASLMPEVRRGYLQWLASDRSASGANPTYPVLYFRGLERRLFHEQAQADRPALTAEVERLASTFNVEVPLHQAAANFLTGSDLMGGDPPRAAETIPARDWQSEMPLATLIHLGQALKDVRPLFAVDALLWVLGRPGTYLHTPGRRCFAELQVLFGARFMERHPRGLRVRVPKRRVSPAYHAFGNAFTAPIPGATRDLPDITAVTAPLADLVDLLDSSLRDLDAYSRFIGRRPGAARTFEAAFLLPSPLRDEVMATLVADGRRAIEGLLQGQQVGMVSPVALMTAVGLEPKSQDGRIPGTSFNQLTQRLDLLGYGMEPDRRYGGALLKAGSELALFQASGGAPVDVNRGEYASARAMVEIGVLAAAADGHVSEAEFAAVEGTLRCRAGLGEGERSRLSAVARVLRSRARPGAFPARLAALSPEVRQAIASMAVTIVVADGHPSRAEVAFLERLYPALGLSADIVHSALHQRSGGSVGKPQAPTYGTSLDLDATRIARVRAETAEVSAVLAGIFNEEEEPQPEVALSTVTGAASRFAHLDEAHGTLLEALLENSLSRAAFATLAKRMSLLPEGAMETINDWAFDSVGDAILQDEEGQISIITDLRQEVLQARKPA